MEHHDWYGDTADGFAERNAQISRAAERAGRNPGDIARSACALIALDAGAGRRHSHEQVAPVEGGTQRVAAHLAELAEAGADEAILVVHPIADGSIRALGEALALLDG